MASYESSSDLNSMIGIDMGNCSISATIFQNGKLKRIPNIYGNYLTPNYVAFCNPYGRLVGEDAKDQEIINPGNTFFGIKSMIGHNVPTSSSSFRFFTKAKTAGRFPRLFLEFEKETETRSQQVFVDAVKLLSTVLESIKQDAERFLGAAVSKTVISVPAYFKYFQRHLVCEAVSLAGLNLISIISEPEAAILAYACKTPFIMSHQTRTMIIDVGGGGISACLASMNADKVVIRAIAGQNNCGGQAIIQRVMDRLEEEFNKTHENTLRQDWRSLPIFRVACENAVKKLSMTTEDQVFIGQSYNGVHFTGLLSKPKFNMLIHDVVNRYLIPIRQCLEDAEWDKTDIDNVIVTGGCSQIPKVRHLLIGYFEGIQVNFEESMTVSGAALLGGMPKELVFMRVAPFGLGIKTPSTMTSNGCNMNFFIPKGSHIPTQQTKTVQMSVDEEDPTSVLVEIYEGDNKLIDKNSFLGDVKLTNITVQVGENGERMVELEVTFNVTVNNELIVTVCDKITEKSATLDVSEQLRSLQKDDENLQIAIQSNTKEFTRTKNLIQRELVKDQLEEFCFKIEKLLSDEEEYRKQELSNNVRDEMLDKCAEVKTWADENEMAETPVLQGRLDELKEFCRDKNADFLLEL